MALPRLETPTYELNLPSTGAKVKFRPFLVKEHKILLTMSEADNSEVARIIRELVDVCTFNTLKIKNLPHFDIEFIFMHLRAKSISETVDVVVNCECGEKIDTSFNIEDLKVVKSDDHTNKIMINDEIGIELKYPNMDDVVDVFATKDNQKVIDLIVRSIKAIYNQEDYWPAEEQTKEEIEEFVFSLTKTQFDKPHDIRVVTAALLTIMDR